jgi:hypothetical protein
VFAVTQIALSFVLLAGACVFSALVALQRANTGHDLRQCPAIDAPPPRFRPETDVFVEERRVASNSSASNTSL